MNKFFLFLLTLGIIFTSCSDKRDSHIDVFPIDSTITPSNAFTKLSLDSGIIKMFLKNEVIDDETGIKIDRFYKARNYQYAWFNEEGLTEQAEAFWSAHQSQVNELNDTSVYSMLLHENMERILNEDTTFSQGDNLQNIELNLTVHFFKYIRAAFNGKVSPEEMQWYIPRKKIDYVALLDSFLINRQKEWKPLNQSFYRLQNTLLQYDSILKAGGWQIIMLKKKRLEKGSEDSAITQLKKRLILSGDFLKSDTTDLFTSELEEAVKKSQQSYGFKQTGVVEAPLIQELNVPVGDRIKQMIINMERMRWMPEQNKNCLVVNIPDYCLYLYKNDSVVLRMQVVVGKAANRTVIFSDELKYIVFSPYWNVPRSIVRSEILPAISRDKNYLRRNNMEITGVSNGLPLVRQKPGKGNALGKVKFIFPNRYNIYLHDSPAKGLFKRDKRAFSHGCIRLEKPLALAKYLLMDDVEWTNEKILDAANKNIEKWVTLKKPLPVFIVYFTCWVDNAGLLHFRDDIYGHDERMARHLFK